MVNNKFVKFRVDAFCRIDATKIANYLLNTKYLTRILKFFPPRLTGLTGRLFCRLEIIL